MIDDFEMNRNNVIYNWQRNRNPFIDQPELVEFIWGNQVGTIWNQVVATHEENLPNIQVYPNPTSEGIFIEGLQSPAIIDLYSAFGQKLNTYLIDGNSEIDLNLPKGMYIMTINCEGILKTEKIFVQK